MANQLNNAHDPVWVLPSCTQAEWAHIMLLNRLCTICWLHECTKRHRMQERTNAQWTTFFRWWKWGFRCSLVKWVHQAPMQLAIRYFSGDVAWSFTNGRSFLAHTPLDLMNWKVQNRFIHQKASLTTKRFLHKGLTMISVVISVIVIVYHVAT